jgi:predicted ferric reductase
MADYANFRPSSDKPDEHTSNNKVVVAVYVNNTGAVSIVPLQDSIYRFVAAAVVYGTVFVVVAALAYVDRHWPFVLSSMTEKLVRASIALLAALGILLVAFEAYYDQINGLKQTPTGRALGHGTAITFGLLLLPVGKHTGIAVLAGSAFERLLWLHILLAWVAFVFVCTHFGIMFTAYNPIPHVITSPIILAGIGSWSTFVPLLLISVFFRRKHYHLFRISHAVLFPCVVGLACLHDSRAAIIMSPGIAVWTLDLLVRLWVGFRAAPEVVHSTFDPQTRIATLTVQTSQQVIPAPASYALLLFPSLSIVPHPFTVSQASIPVGERGVRLTFHIRCNLEPTWTGQLAARVASGQLTGSRIVYLGPYGKLQVPLDRVDTAVLVCGGIGVTPMLSTLQHLARVTDQRPRSVTLLWVVRHAEDYALAVPILQEASGGFANVGRKLHIIIHVSDSQRHDHHELKSISSRLLQGETHASTDSTATQRIFDVHQGRPKMGEIFEKAIAATETIGEAGCYICGPDAMAQAAMAEAQRIGMHTHLEVFEF